MDDNNGKYSGFFSKKLRAGKRRTYFFDVRSTKQGDYFLTITESKKKFDGEGYDCHKIFLYKEDFKKFFEALNETVDYMKTELMPEYDFNAERPVRQSNSTNTSPTKQEENNLSENANQAATTNSSYPADNSSVASDTNASPSISDDEEIDWN